MKQIYLIVKKNALVQSSEFKKELPHIFLGVFPW